MRPLLCRYRNWIPSPRADGKPGLIVLALMLWRLRTAREARCTFALAGVAINEDELARCTKPDLRLVE